MRSYGRGYRSRAVAPNANPIRVSIGAIIALGIAAMFLSTLFGCGVATTAANVAGSAVSTGVSVAGSVARATADAVSGPDKKPDQSVDH
jgi:uncharacterized membrane protein